MYVLTGSARFTTLRLQQDQVYEDLADVIETDFAGENGVLMELKDLYDSCILAQVSDDFDLGPVLELYKELGKFNCKHSEIKHVPLWGANKVYQ